jgi:hypothetical protein
MATKITRGRKATAFTAVGALTLGALGVGIAAQFTESASTADSHVSAGTGRMELGGEVASGTVVSDIVPGDTVIRTLSVANRIDTPGAGYTWDHATLALAYLNSQAGTSTDASLKLEQGPDPMTVAVTDLGTDGAVGGTGRSADRVVSATRPVGDQSDLTLMRSGTDHWIPEEVRTYQVALVFPATAGNAYEGATAELGYTVNATQRLEQEAGTFDAFPNLASEVDNFPTAPGPGVAAVQVYGYPYDHEIDLWWDPIEDATSYAVSCAAPGQPLLNVPTGSDMVNPAPWAYFAGPSVANGIEYTCTVSASPAGVATSGVLAITPGDRPTVHVTGSAGDQTLDLAWDYKDGATGYNVACTNPDAGELDASLDQVDPQLSDPAVTFSGAVNDLTYDCQVSTVPDTVADPGFISLTPGVDVGTPVIDPGTDPNTGGPGPVPPGGTGGRGTPQTPVPDGLNTVDPNTLSSVWSLASFPPGADQNDYVWASFPDDGKVAILNVRDAGTADAHTQSTYVVNHQFNDPRGLLIGNAPERVYSGYDYVKDSVYVAERGTGKVWRINVRTGATNVVVSGLDHPMDLTGWVCPAGTAAAGAAVQPTCLYISTDDGIVMKVLDSGSKSTIITDARTHGSQGLRLKANPGNGNALELWVSNLTGGGATRWSVDGDFLGDAYNGADGAMGAVDYNQAANQMLIAGGNATLARYDLGADVAGAGAYTSSEAEAALTAVQSNGRADYVYTASHEANQVYYGSLGGEQTEIWPVKAPPKFEITQSWMVDGTVARNASVPGAVSYRTTCTLNASGISEWVEHDPDGNQIALSERTWYDYQSDGWQTAVPEPGTQRDFDFGGYPAAWDDGRATCTMVANLAGGTQKTMSTIQFWFSFVT